MTLLTDETLLHEAMYYQDLFLAEKRANHHKSIPGPLVAELLRQIEGTMDGVTQVELEELFLSPGTARSRGDNSGANWRNYTGHRNRDAVERKEWRNWYGRYGRRDKLQAPKAPDPFLFQPLEPSSAEEGQQEFKFTTDILPPLQRGLPQDGRPMSFSKMRDIIHRWSIARIDLEVKNSASLGTR